MIEMDGVVARPMERFRIVFLRAVVGKRLSGDLATCDAAAVSEDRKKQGIDARLFLKDIENFFDTLVNERHGSDLNPDEFFSRWRGHFAAGIHPCFSTHWRSDGCSSQESSNGCGSRALQERAPRGSLLVLFRHG